MSFDRKEISFFKLGLNLKIEKPKWDARVVGL